MIDYCLSYYKNPYRSRKANAKQLKQLKQTQSKLKANAKQLKQLKQTASITMVGMFLFAIALFVITMHMMACIMSCFYKMPEDYVNPYRLPPVRKEHESYKRYERQQYLDSLKNYKRRG